MGMERPKPIPIISAVGLMMSFATIAAACLSVYVLFVLVELASSDYFYIIRSLTILPIAEALASIPLCVGSIYLITGRPGTQKWFRYYVCALLAAYVLSFVIFLITNFVLNEHRLYLPSVAWPAYMVYSRIAYLTAQTSVVPVIVAQHFAWAAFALYVNWYLNRPPASTWIAAAQEARQNVNE